MINRNNEKQSDISRENFPARLLLLGKEKRSNQRYCSLRGSQTIPIYARGLEIAMILNFEIPRNVTHMIMNECVSSLNSYEFKGKEAGPLSSDEEINLLVQESIKAASEVVKPKKEEKTSYDRRSVN